MIKGLFGLMAAAAMVSANPAAAASCKLTPKQVVTRFMTTFYIDKQVRRAFETWVDPGYIQHNPMAATGREAAIGFLEPYVASNPGMRYEIKRIIAEGNLVVVHSWGRMNDADRGRSIVDILRVQGCKVMEHWDVEQDVPETAANTNTMF
jgi:predicted SnoaL-like aldol condensation-catalyzing enzyme